MYGNPRNFGSSFNMNQHLMDAASGPANTVTREAFERDVSTASAVTVSDSTPQPVDSTPVKRSGTAPLGEASGAGYNASKSAYIESNKGGYQARPRDIGLSVPERTSSFIPDTKQSIRMASYRKNHLKSVTRGLRALI